MSRRPSNPSPGLLGASTLFLIEAGKSEFAKSTSTGGGRLTLPYSNACNGAFDRLDRCPRALVVLGAAGAQPLAIQLLAASCQMNWTVGGRWPRYLLGAVPSSPTGGRAMSRSGVYLPGFAFCAVPVRAVFCFLIDCFPCFALRPRARPPFSHRIPPQHPSRESGSASLCPSASLN